MSYTFASILKYFCLLLLTASYAFNAHCQADWFPKGFGTQLGVSIELGTHHGRIGVLARVFSHWNHVQANIELAGFYQQRAYATDKQCFEGQLRFGVVGAWGQQDPFWENPFMGPTANQMSRPYSIGYSYNVYWDNQDTDQCTGSVAFRVRQLRLLLENDFLAFLSQDKHRTGGLSLAFQQGDWQMALQHLAWTGDPYAAGTRTIKDDSTYTKDIAKNGYRDLSTARYKDRSLGILRLRASYRSPWANQEIGMSVGVDADQIRHALQNKTIHDSFLLKNPHIPMIDKEGNPFLFKEGQKVRPIRPYGDILFNPLSIY